MGMMGTGLIVLKESALYSWGELFLLFSSDILVVLGIYVLTKKQSMILVKDQDL